MLMLHAIIYNLADYASMMQMYNNLSNREHIIYDYDIIF